eukprot:CAMPEP_0115845732 /NCGR_PEP_ID=MMETSP0287-20121206/9506_1 /TAXON_ID=412157 /ORGANISM="Chrysochromulina rotalis, Strain UIO044" /LENGTH=389 /DNA_ID=CAMNT_0003299519 /DNA_START=35 /DNA_END=1204 /DNA_ORIENTATION=+
MPGYTPLSAQDSARSSDKLPPAAPLPPPEKPTVKIADTKRIDSYLSAIQSKSDAFDPRLGGCISAAKPVVIALIQGIQFVYPWYMWLYGWIAHYWSLLPSTGVRMVFGAALCFFGGTYVASIAAIEAFRQFGFEKVYANFVVIKEQWDKVMEANKIDDAKDADRDGTADVDQMEPAELAKHKLELVMTKVEKPEALQEAFGALFTAYLAVLATLRLEFARTTAFALGIVEMAKFPVTRALAPAFNAALGQDLAHWTKTLIESGLSFLAIVLAWYLQMIVSAFYSGLRGGRMFADALIDFLEDKKFEDGKPWLSKLPESIAPMDEDGQYKADESYLDEIIGYGLAAFGFSFQFFNGFSLPFPLNLIFLPLTIIEWFLRIQISMEGAKPLV